MPSHWSMASYSIVVNQKCVEKCSYRWKSEWIDTKISELSREKKWAMNSSSIHRPNEIELEFWQRWSADSGGSVDYQSYPFVEKHSTLKSSPNKRESFGKMNSSHWCWFMLSFFLLLLWSGAVAMQQTPRSTKYSYRWTENMDHLLFLISSAIADKIWLSTKTAAYCSCQPHSTKGNNSFFGLLNNFWRLHAFVSGCDGCGGVWFILHW